MTEKNTRKESPLPDDEKGDELLKRMLKTPPKQHSSVRPENKQGRNSLNAVDLSSKD